MIVTAWNNGRHTRTGTGYGLKMTWADRDRYLDRSWSCVYVQLPGGGVEIEVNVDKPSFWTRHCSELINRDIGRWLIDKGYAPWPSGHPPKFRLTRTQGNHFVLRER